MSKARRGPSTLGLPLRAVSLDRTALPEPPVYPFSVPVVQALDRIEFSAPVTFLVGENGSGKSTLLEAVAAAADMIAVGADDIGKDTSLAPARRLAAALRLTWSRRTRRGFFLRAEDFFGYAKRLRQMGADLEGLSSEYGDRFDGYSRLLAQGMADRQREGMRRRYGDDLDGRSHGESFLALFEARLVPGGLYLLDEPEAPLSPLRQLAFLALLKRFAGEDQCQFLIATHSPLLMAYPGAQILLLGDGPATPVGWDELEHVTLTRAFLNDPRRFLDKL